MCKVEQLNLIVGIPELDNGIYELKGIRKDKEVYEIYNQYTNDFIL